MEQEMNELRKEFIEWKKGVAVLMVREEEAREECRAARQERDHLARQLSHAMTRLTLLKTKLDELIHNYAAIASVIDTKNRLAEEVERLQQEGREEQQKHKEEVERLRKECDEATLKTARQMEEALKKEEERAKEVAEKHKEKLKEKEEELEAVKEEVKKEKEKHSQVLIEQREKMHEEQEQLRGRLAQLQKTINSRSLSDLDLFASKLQAIRSEFEEKLRERDSQLSEAKEELQQAHEALRHQQLLSVVRNVSTAPNAPTPTPTSAFSPAAQSSFSIRDEVDEIDVGGASEPMGKKSKIGHNRTQPMFSRTASTPQQAPSTPNARPAHTPNTPRSRLANKRQLYSGKSLLIEDL